MRQRVEGNQGQIHTTEEQELVILLVVFLVLLLAVFLFLCFDWQIVVMFTFSMIRSQKKTTTCETSISSSIKYKTKQHESNKTSSQEQNCNTHNLFCCIGGSRPCHILTPVAASKSTASRSPSATSRDWVTAGAARTSHVLSIIILRTNQKPA